MKILPAQTDNYINRIANEKISGCLIFGHDLASIAYRFDIIAKKIVADLSDPFLVANISKERLAQDRGVIAEEFYSFSMMGGRKLILLKDCDAAAVAALKDILSDKDFATKSDNFILINGGDLDKGSALRKLCEDNPHIAAIACYEDDERVIKKFIADQLQAKQIKSSPQVIDFLFERFGKNRQTVIAEVEKIDIFLGTNRELTLETASNLTASEAEINANEFVMNFAAQKFDLATKQSEKLFRDGFEPITLIRFLSNYLQKLYFARCELDIKKVDFEEVVKSQRLFFKVENEFRKHLKILSKDFLVRNLKSLENLEIKIKNYSMSPKLVFTTFMQDALRENSKN